MFKFESDEYKLGATLTICVTIIILAAILYNHSTKVRYIKSGYTKTTLVGVQGPIWVKE